MNLALVLDDLCVRLGLCVAPVQREQLLSREHPTIESFAQAVFEAEDLNPADHRELYAAALDRIRRHYRPGQFPA